MPAAVAPAAVGENPSSAEQWKCPPDYDLALARFAANSELVFHDCALQANPSHTGVADLELHYSSALRDRLVLSHYASAGVANELRAMGYRVAEPGRSCRLVGTDCPQLRCVG